jgi:O-antigen biosynthesis protein
LYNPQSPILSIIIVNFNVKYFVEQCLNSVYRAQKNISLEVIVVDNNSVDGSVQSIKEKFPSVLLIENKENTGFSYANNQAIKIAKGKFVLLLNPDTVVQEDCFEKTLEFMHFKEDAGALGVMMVDGKGKFLPESKRGLPTPVVAFYKIFGLSTMFPNSKKFGKYHLGYLDKMQIHEVDVLSGAFMLIRKETLDKIGLLDEDFFMYGEDIDLSYRVIKGGYKNYYFPHTRIIHYKGESTKKSSVNYVFVFYKAMVIFAKKHFSSQHASLFSKLINVAIWFRASLALTMRFIKNYSLLICDIFISYISFYLLSILWNNYVKNYGNEEFPEAFYSYTIPSYVFIILFNIWFAGGYDKPTKISNLIKGMAWSTLLILSIYALLPENVRYSRGLIILGIPLLFTYLILSRKFLDWIGLKEFSLERNERKRFLIVGNYKEYQRVVSLINDTALAPEYLGFLSVEDSSESKEQLGTLTQIDEVVRINKITEVIFCSQDIDIETIISKMAQLGVTGVDFKIAPPESIFLIGSNSINSSGDLYVIDLKNILKPENVRFKRAFDVVISLLNFIFFPFVLFFVNKKINYFKNLFQVLFGYKTWVGYSLKYNNNELPKIKTGVLNTTHILSNTHVHVSDDIALNYDRLYAKNYNLKNDIDIVFKNIEKLGNS